MIQQDIRKFDFIDALRGLAVLSVILVHSSQVVPPSSSAIQWFARAGASGVQLFYIASAFTLCISLTSRNSYEFFPLRNFFIRRFFRIAPLFYMAIALYLLINGFAHGYWSPNGIKWWFIPMAVTFLHGFHPETINSIVPGGWSIAVEMTFYLILPLVIRYVGSSLKSWCYLFVFSLVLYCFNKLVIPGLFHYPENQQYIVRDYLFLNFLSQLPVFVIGILSYIIFRKDYSRKRMLVVGGLLFPVLLVEFCYSASKISHHLVSAGLFSVILILLASWPTQLLVNRVTIMLGKLSFGMYLTHFAILALFSRLGFDVLFPSSNPASLLFFSGVVLVAACVSFFLHRYIEKPGIELGKHLVKRIEQIPRNPEAFLLPGDSQGTSADLGKSYQA